MKALGGLSDSFTLSTFVISSATQVYSTDLRTCSFILEQSGSLGGAGHRWEVPAIYVPELLLRHGAEVGAGVRRVWARREEVVGPVVDVAGD